MSSYRQIVKLLVANAGEKRMSEVFDDFVEMSALAVRNAVDSWGYDEREEQYLRTAGRYDRDELNRFAHALALVVNAMEQAPCDVLGRLYMELELGNGRLGQFYTPYDVARLMAGMQIDAIAEQIQSQGFASLYEPACGAAAFIVAITQEMRTAGLNPQTQLHVTAEDIAPQAVHMAYIHLSLLHVPAVVHRRNTLTMETFDSWRTPAHILGGWGWKLRHVDTVERAQKLLDSPATSGGPSFTTTDHRMAPGCTNLDSGHGGRLHPSRPDARTGGTLMPLGTAR
ncbi:SAM-dependent methyltransferase [Kribbella sp. NBC_01245]|uniref:N-6 DNA methylase n=1 Tax=Kribbella sp. NBC_01245 TaxID=2903578 RepID=UPI002E289476|nr:N-6 DNA methylase [Kribbella sp. NBC_01245]